MQESIAECRTQVRDQFQLLLFLTRFLANAVILAMLAFSIYCISFAVQTSQTVEQTGGLINKNQVNHFIIYQAITNAYSFGSVFLATISYPFISISSSIFTRNL